MKTKKKPARKRTKTFIGHSHKLFADGVLSRPFSGTRPREPFIRTVSGELITITRRRPVDGIDPAIAAAWALAGNP